MKVNKKDSKEKEILGRFLDMLNRSGVLDVLPKRSVFPDGRPPCNYSLLLVAILFAFSDRHGTIREIERSCRFDLRYICLMSDTVPARSTIDDFIRKTIFPNADRIFVSVTKAMMSEMGYFPLDQVYIDGSKFEADANKYKFVWKPRKREKKLLADIRTLSEECGLSFPKKPERPYSALAADLVLALTEKLKDDGKDPATIKCGKGKRRTEDERRYLTAQKYLGRELTYEEENAICGPDRNSYFRTDHDATAMCLKEDYYSGKGSNIHAAYNVQTAESRGMIVDFYVSQDRSDAKTFSPFLEKMKRDWGNYPDLVCADSGYGSPANYRFLSEHSIGKYVKYTNWEGEVSGRRPALLSLGPEEFRKPSARKLSKKGKKINQRVLESMERRKDGK